MSAWHLVYRKAGASDRTSEKAVEIRTGSGSAGNAGVENVNGVLSFSTTVVPEGIRWIVRKTKCG